jgi:hypothetical protein
MPGHVFERAALSRVWEGATLSAPKKLGTRRRVSLVVISERDEYKQAAKENDDQDSGGSKQLVCQSRYPQERVRA